MSDRWLVHDLSDGVEEEIRKAEILFRRFPRVTPAPWLVTGPHVMIYGLETVTIPPGRYVDTQALCDAANELHGWKILIPSGRGYTVDWAEYERRNHPQITIRGERDEQ